MAKIMYKPAEYEVIKTQKTTVVPVGAPELDVTGVAPVVQTYDFGGPMTVEGEQSVTLKNGKVVYATQLPNKLQQFYQRVQAAFKTLTANASVSGGFTAADMNKFEEAKAVFDEEMSNYIATGTGRSSIKEISRETVKLQKGQSIDDLLQ